MSNPEAVLFANEAFYAAFRSGDMRAMAAVWAEDHEIVCLHPGAGPIIGRAEVLESWRQILRNPTPITAIEPRVVLTGESSAFVTCFEVIGDGALIATNIFLRQGRLWRMVHHQAGPTRARPEAPAQDADKPLPN